MYRRRQNISTRIPSEDDSRQPQHPTIASGENKATNQTQQLEQLLKERQATLQQLVEVVTAEYRSGTTGFDSVARATGQLIDAELDMAKNAESRITTLQRQVELMKSLFSTVEERFRNGQVSKSQVLAAKATMLESEIHLAREQADGGETKR